MSDTYLGSMIGISSLAGMIGDYIMHQQSMDFNSAEAEKARQFSSDEAKKSREFSAHEAELSRTFNSAEAQKERQWQKMMSDTAHQREVADLKAAGLNPILAANSGSAVSSGASASSTPAVSTFGGSSAQATSSPFKMSNSINSALGMWLDNNQHSQEMEFKIKSIPPKRSGYSQNIYRNGKLVREIDTNYRY